MPTSYKYILWSAFNSEGLFGLTQDLKKPKKNQKYLIFKDKEENENSSTKPFILARHQMKRNLLHTLFQLRFSLKLFRNMQDTINTAPYSQEGSGGKCSVLPEEPEGAL